jgi:hypothetical protein
MITSIIVREKGLVSTEVSKNIKSIRKIYFNDGDLYRVDYPDFYVDYPEWAVLEIKHTKD